MLLFLQTVIFCILKVLLIHGYLILINVNVKLLRWKGQGKGVRVRSHSCAASVKCLCIPHLLPGILIAGGLYMDQTGCRKWSPESSPVYNSSSRVRIVELVNSFKSADASCSTLCIANSLRPFSSSPMHVIVLHYTALGRGSVDVIAPVV